MARIIRNQQKPWSNFHTTFNQTVEELFVISNDRSGLPLDNYNLTTQAILDLLDEGLSRQKQVKAGGSRWSLSPINFTNQWYLDTTRLSIAMHMEGGELDSSYPGVPDDLAFAQCGVGIKQLSTFFGRRQRSLKASGASNGQTIAGAIGTGVHGSSIEFGSVQDFVVGLHILISGSKNVYIERSSYPVVSSSFVQSIGATLIRDDDMFNAALVSMGAFGFIHGVMVEAEPNYVLRNFVLDISREEVDELIPHFDFANASFQVPGMEGTRPWHFKLYINPYRSRGAIKAEVMYKEAYPAGYTSPHQGGVVQDYNKDLLGVIGALSQQLKGSIAVMLRVLQNYGFPKNTAPGGEVATLADMFYDTTTGGQTYSCAMGIPLQHSAAALKIIHDEMNINKDIPAIIALRFVKSSKALMAFTKFSDITCILELDGVRVPIIDQFVHKIPALLDRQRIPYTFHWGKDNPMNTAMVQRMYGADYDKWVRQRSRLMTFEEASLFSSSYSASIGLAAWVAGETPVV